MIPVLDLGKQYEGIRTEMEEAVQGVLESGYYILGPNVKALEQEIAAYCNCGFGVGVASGTDALRLTLEALAIGPGDEVVTTPFTFVATANTISRSGATPVFADIDPQTFNLDPILVERAITERTKAILVVHLFGQLAAMEALMELGLRYDLPVIEDSAQAIGASYDGQRACSFGVAGCLSFYPTKNLGACGDGGMVITCNPNMAEEIDLLRRHGGRVKYHHERVGYNSRLDELQAAILRVKFRHLDEWIEARRYLAGRYNELLAGLPVKTPHEAPGMRHVYHQYTIRAPRRNELQAFLEERGIGVMIYYPVPLHLQEMYADMDQGRGSFPEAERAAEEVLSLPIYPELTDEQIGEVADAIGRFYGA
jgi:dTDP-4-amino-4,6-dideoxygalactose transaminase